MIDRAHAETEVTEAPPRRRRRSTLLVGLILGSGIAVLAGIAISIALYRDPLPYLTAETLDAAEKRWQEHGPANYQLSVEILGRQPGQVELTVRNGEPVAMTRDGRAPKQQRTWAVWTIPGQFDMLQLELEHAAHAEQIYGASTGSQAVVKAEFDPQFGYPIRFRRQVMGGSSLDLEWHVTGFKTLDGK